MGAEAFMRAEGIRHVGQRLAEEFPQHVPVGDVVGHLAHAIHIVREGDEAGRQAGQRGKGLPHPGRAGDFPECADMRQAGGAVAGLEQRHAFAGRLHAGDKLRRLLEGPGLGRGCSACRLVHKQNH
jgi:hypothetical protein